MDFIHKQTREEITFAQLKERYPLTCFPSDFESGSVADFEGYAPVFPTLPPEHDAATHKAVRLPSVEQGGKWVQAWDVVPLSPEEIATARAASVPQSCTRRQGRLALLQAGQLAAVETAIAAITDPVQRMSAQIEYEADTWERANAFLQAMWAQLGGTPDELDDLFMSAVTL